MDVPRPALTAREVLVALGMVVGVNLLGALPAVFFGADTGWFERPPLYPPELAFPIAWTILFSLLGLALFLVWRAGRGANVEGGATTGHGVDVDRRAVRIAYGAFAGQFALNLAWTPVFFGLQRTDLGLVVIVALWLAIVVTIWAFDRVDRRAALLVVPYLAWVSFATYLSTAIHLGWG